MRDKTPAGNEHIGEIAAVCPQKRQCKFGSYYPARTFVKPLPRQYATTPVFRNGTPAKKSFFRGAGVGGLCRPSQHHVV